MKCITKGLILKPLRYAGTKSLIENINNLNVSNSF